ncbi:MAG: hypothetical protein LUD69_09095 [Oscillospiraceae bacterium]|nr:hypothetical protein [Oscillospiraceae bacterium]
MRYKYLEDLPEREQRMALRKLRLAGILDDYGEDETGRAVIDLSADMARLLMMAYRGGAFDGKLLYAGLRPAVQ